MYKIHLSFEIQLVTLKFVSNWPKFIIIDSNYRRVLYENVPFLLSVHPIYQFLVYSLLLITYLVLLGCSIGTLSLFSSPSILLCLLLWLHLLLLFLLSQHFIDLFIWWAFIGHFCCHFLLKFCVFFVCWRPILVFSSFVLSLGDIESFLSFSFEFCISSYVCFFGFFKVVWFIGASVLFIFHHQLCEHILSTCWTTLICTNKSGWIWSGCRNGVIIRLDKDAIVIWYDRLNFSLAFSTAMYTFHFAQYLLQVNLWFVYYNYINFCS